MVLVKKLWLLFFITLSLDVDAKEYLSINVYHSTFPIGLHNGKDGNWLKSDREKSTEVWNEANKINIKKIDGYLEYRDIHQRCCFYKWLQQQTDSLGFETKWAKAAKETTSKLKNLLSPLAIMVGNSNHDIEDFILIGNGIIFDDIWKDLKSLVEHKPLKGIEAEKWDGHLLLKEQNLIDPYYRRLTVESLKKLQKSLRKETTISKILPGYEFEGRLLSIKDRWFYGIKLMGYRHPDINR